MSVTTVKLLEAACEIAGGDRALARQLGIRTASLRRFMADERELPDALLLRTVDIILGDPNLKRTIAPDIAIDPVETPPGTRPKA